MSKGYIYILENQTAQRVKVGLTIGGTSTPKDRLVVVNQIWSRQIITCQICGGRLHHINGFCPPHKKSGRLCRGGKHLPLENDLSLAEQYLKELKDSLNALTGSEKGSSTRMANTLEKRIEKYRLMQKPFGIWKLRTTYYTDFPEAVEASVHKILESSHDRLAPIGEVFTCSHKHAEDAVKQVLIKLDLLDSTEKKNY